VPITSEERFMRSRIGSRGIVVVVWGALSYGLSTGWAADVERVLEEEVVVIGTRERLQSLPGSGEVIDREELNAARVFTVNEAVRRVPGVYARDEEGFGLRPNLGVRGLNPTRSSKILLLEDGLPLTFAPYGDNASYYHPPVERFARIEVLKGSGQIAFGPQTIGGVINYVTPRVPDAFGGRLILRGGERAFREGHLEVGDRLASGAGWLANATWKRSDGVRENMRFEVADLNLKLEQPLGDEQSLVLRASGYDEDSQAPYSGLTLAEYLANPRANPFVNDDFDAYRWSVSATHAWRVADDRALQTSVYYTYFDRDWWRQSSNSGQRPNDASDPACGGLANLSTTCGNEGRLRQYYTAGIEPRFAAALGAIGADSRIEAGARFHVEKQSRVQANGDTPAARAPGVGPNAGIREDNRRDVQALSGFVQARLDFGRLDVLPGVRIERIEYERLNRLDGARGRSDLTEIVPGLGATFSLDPRWTLFAGAHRGFAPPRVEDVIAAGGGSVDLDAELSWNYEIGLRAAPYAGLRIDATAFRMDFENQIVPASVAGGIGATLTSAGETLHQGAELAVAFDTQPSFGTAANWYARAALTWLADAEFRSTRFSSVPGFANVRVTGNRLPYAPENLASVTLGVELPRGLRLQVDAYHSSGMYTDDLETVAVTPNGQRGRLAGYTVLNATAEFALPAGFSAFLSLKNLDDELYVIDMSRGLIPGPPRLLQAGIEYRF
jgi:Fe(3+) dicitrate transport protein